MDKRDDFGTAEDVLILSASDDALERAGAPLETAAFTLNFCTYNYYQCGPIGDGG